MAEHKIAIVNRIATAETGIVLICNNPTDTIRFEFDDEWKGISAKTARFAWEGKYIDVPFSGNVVQVPEIFQTNYMHVGVFADAIASTCAKLSCRFSIKCLGGKVVPPSDDVYGQIIALINAGIDANDGVGVSSAYVNDAGHLFVTLTTGKSIDCGMVKGADGADGKNGKDGAGAEEYADMLAQIAEVKSDISDLQNFTPQPFEVSGDEVQANCYQDAPLNVVTTLKPIQAGSGDPSPSNIRAISGWTGAKITRCGKNLLRNTGVSKTTNGIMFTVNKDGSITATGTSTGRAQIGVGSVTLPAGSYIVSQGFVGDMWTSGLAFISYKKNGETVYDTLHATQDRTLTLTETTSVSYVCDIQRENITLNNLVFYPMIRFASDTDATYVPYQGNDSFSIEFGQTVYGGTLDWNTGILTVDHGVRVLDGSSNKVWVNNSNYGNVFAATISNAIPPTSSAVAADATSSHYPIVTGSQIYAGVEGFAISASADGIHIYDSARKHMSAAEYNAWLAAQNAAGTPVQVLYRMATPQKIQLTAQDITALHGINTLYGDGTVTVTGRNDILWLTNSLNKRIKMLEEAIVSLGGNV